MKRKRVHHFNQNNNGYWLCDAPQCNSMFLTKEMLQKHWKLHENVCCYIIYLKHIKNVLIIINENILGSIWL